MILSDSHTFYRFNGLVLTAQAKKCIFAWNLV